MSSVTSLSISPVHLGYAESAMAPAESGKEPLRCYGIEYGWKEVPADLCTNRMPTVGSSCLVHQGCANARLLIPGMVVPRCPD